MQLDKKSNDADATGDDADANAVAGCSSAPTAFNNIADEDDKRTNSLGSPLTTVANSVSISSLPSPSTTCSTADLLSSSNNSSPSTSSSHTNLPNSNPTAARQVFEALAKFQTCLFMLSNTVGRLSESLKLILPFGSSSASGSTPGVQGQTTTTLESSSSSSSAIALTNFPSGMVRRVSLCPIIGRLGSNNGNSEGNGTLNNNGNAKPDTVVNVSGNGKSNIQESSNSTSSKIWRGCSTWLKKYGGIILALFASLCMSLVTLIVKFMEGYHPVSKVIWRLQGVLLPSALIVLYVKYYQKRPLIVWKAEEDSKQARSKGWMWKIFLLLVARGIVGCSADIFQYYSLKSLPLADSTVISFSTPIFVCIVAHFMLGEKCGIVPIFTALLTLCGVIVICKPPFLTGEKQEQGDTVWLGNILAVLCMISNTLTTVLMRYLQNIHFAVTMLALGIFGTLEGFIVTIFTSPFEIPNKNLGQDLAFALLIAGLFFVGQLALTLALQKEEAGVVSLVRTCDVLFAFVWQLLFLHQTAKVSSYIGAVIVTLGVIITAVRRWIGDLPESSKLRKNVSFILR